MTSKALGEAAPHTEQGFRDGLDCTQERLLAPFKRPHLFRKDKKNDPFGSDSLLRSECCEPDQGDAYQQRYLWWKLMAWLGTSVMMIRPTNQSEKWHMQQWSCPAPVLDRNRMNTHKLLWWKVYPGFPRGLPGFPFFLRSLTGSRALNGLRWVPGCL